jgi:hypothetical protein
MYMPIIVLSTVQVLRSYSERGSKLGLQQTLDRRAFYKYAQYVDRQHCGATDTAARNSTFALCPYISHNKVH